MAALVDYLTSWTFIVQVTICGIDGVVRGLQKTFGPNIREGWRIYWRGAALRAQMRREPDPLRQERLWLEFLQLDDPFLSLEWRAVFIERAQSEIVRMEAGLPVISELGLSDPEAAEVWSPDHAHTSVDRLLLQAR